MKKLGILCIITLIIILLIPVTAQAQTLIYKGEIEFSAYYPTEEPQYPNNFKGQDLDELVGDIVACPTGSDLLGKTILILTDTGDWLTRRVWDTGCKRNRLDMLTANHKAMNAWGLRDCHVWIIGED